MVMTVVFQSCLHCDCTAQTAYLLMSKCCRDLAHFPDSFSIGALELASCNDLTASPVYPDHVKLTVPIFLNLDFLCYHPIWTQSEYSGQKQHTLGILTNDCTVVTHYVKKPHTNFPFKDQGHVTTTFIFEPAVCCWSSSICDPQNSISFRNHTQLNCISFRAVVYKWWRTACTWSVCSCLVNLWIRTLVRQTA